MVLSLRIPPIIVDGAVRYDRIFSASCCPLPFQAQVIKCDGLGKILDCLAWKERNTPNSDGEAENGEDKKPQDERGNRADGLGGTQALLARQSL
jgi:hypothetical protein